MGKKRQVVRILWDDSADIGSAEWLDDPSHDITGMRCTSVGFLVKETKEWIAITHTFTETDASRGVFTIPRGCVVSVEYL